jgi:hypothetical protein
MDVKPITKLPNFYGQNTFLLLFLHSMTKMKIFSRSGMLNLEGFLRQGGIPVYMAHPVYPDPNKPVSKSLIWLIKNVQFYLTR